MSKIQIAIDSQDRVKVSGDVNYASSISEKLADGFLVNHIELFIGEDAEVYCWKDDGKWMRSVTSPESTFVVDASAPDGSQVINIDMPGTGAVDVRIAEWECGSLKVRHWDVDHN